MRFMCFLQICCRLPCLHSCYGVRASVLAFYMYPDSLYMSSSLRKSFEISMTHVACSFISSHGR